MKKVMSFILSLTLVFCIALTGCSTKNHKQEDTSSATGTQQSNKDSGPVTIKNLNGETTYTKAPEKVFVDSFNNAEIMVALGLGGKIVAIAPGHDGVGDVLPEYQAAFKNIPVIEGVKHGVAPLETVLAKIPDFVFGNYYTFLAKNSGTPADYKKNGINIYAAEGTYVEKATLENTYNDILNIGKIFRVEDRANQLVEKLRKQEADVKKKTANLQPVNVFVYDSGEDKPFTIGGTGLENNLVSLAGGKNIFDEINKHYAEVSFEELVKRNPDVIVVFEYGAEDDGEKKVKFLKNKPELANVSAIKNNRFVTVSLFSVFPSLQNVNAIEKIAKGIHPNSFK